MAQHRTNGGRRQARPSLLFAPDDPNLLPTQHNHRCPSVRRGSPGGRLVGRVACAVAPVVPLVTGCSAGSGSATSTAPTESGSLSAAASSSARPATPEPSTTRCPNPEGQACLGHLAAGTYTTGVFHPAITYRVPAGWANYEDNPGNFPLVPPGGNLPGVNAGTSDFIGIYTSVGPPKGCEDGVAPGVLPTPAGYRKWAAHKPGFRDPRFRPVSVGGLSGIVADLRPHHRPRRHRRHRVRCRGPDPKRSRPAPAGTVPRRRAPRTLADRVPHRQARRTHREVPRGRHDRAGLAHRRAADPRLLTTGC
jgi:hypothetical protein